MKQVLACRTARQGYRARPWDLGRGDRRGGSRVEQRDQARQPAVAERRARGCSLVAPRCGSRLARRRPGRHRRPAQRRGARPPTSGAGDRGSDGDAGLATRGSAPTAGRSTAAGGTAGATVARPARWHHRGERHLARATCRGSCRGGATAPGVTATEIKVASIVTASGPLPGRHRGRLPGRAAYFAKINAEGGVCGRKLTLLKGDDGLDPQRARGEFLRLEPRCSPSSAA